MRNSEGVIEIQRRAGRQSGIALLSAVISVMIISTTVTAGLLGVSTASRITGQTSVHTTATAAILSQIDFIRDAEYVPTGGQYATVPGPAGFAITNQTAVISGGNENIQAVTIQVSKGAEIILQTTIIKANR